MDIIPYVLSETDLDTLTDSQLNMLAKCSTDMVLEEVLKYLENAGDSVYSGRIRGAYATKIALREFLTSEETKSNVEIAQRLSYTSITPMLTEEELIVYKNAIESIINNKYAIPYISPISGETIKTLREEVKTNNKALAERLKKFSYLFKDSPHKSATGTIVKRVIRNRVEYEIILRGIEFMLERKRKGANPNSWRYL